ncbi:tyrosine-type recombinase/integrase [Butyricicoccus sp.]|uniref:tyrosine-type recombinase/integrase n=1 Tax=Butyricicoccus sp. TaxID=2049021 RepID=UPI003F1464BB
MLAKDCAEEFKLDCQLRRLSSRTIKGYYNNTILFLTYIQKRESIIELEDIRPLHIKRYMQYLIGRELSASYANNIMKCLRAFFVFAVQEEYLTENPAAKVKWQKEGKTLIKTFTDDEVSALLGSFDFSTYLSARNKLILAVAFGTGMRNSEICGIQCTDIRDSVILVHGKGNKERYVPLTPYLKKIMLKYERLRTYYFYNKELVFDNYFLSRTGRPLTKEAIEHVFNQANAIAHVRSDIRCSPHTARHYYAQASLRNGLDVYSLSRVLGHENINITKRYLQSLNDESIVQMATSTSPLENIKLR